MDDAKNTKDDKPLKAFEVNSSPSLMKDQPENNYPKLIVRDFDATYIQDTYHIHKDEQKDLFAPKKINGPPNEEDVIKDFLLSISSSFKETKQGNFEAQDEKMISNENVGMDRVLIDTAAPFESVKAAVSKFGGIVDWKAHRVQTLERRKLIEKELGKAQEEIPIYKKQYQEAEAHKVRILKELDSTKRLVEDLKLNVERVQTEEQQAKQDLELAKLRVEELEQGIEDEASISAKAQLEVARSRHVEANKELKTVKNELEQLKKDYALLVSERDREVKKAKVAVSDSLKVEKLVEEMMIELIDVNESLGHAHGAHLEAEEEKIGAIADTVRERLNCEKDLKDAAEATERLKFNIMETNEKKKKLDTDTASLVELKTELAAYVETKTEADSQKEGLQKEVEKVKLEIGKGFLEINSMKMSEVWLNSEIEKEKSELLSVKQKKETEKSLVASLERELREIQSQISSLRTREKERREKMTELPMKLEIAGQESDQAKTFLKLACDEWEKQKIETGKAKAEAKTMESKLLAVQKESEDAKSLEKLAREAIDASKENENNSDLVLQEGTITLSLKEHYALSKRAHEAQERADALMTNVKMQINIAKESETNSQRKLEEVGLEMKAQKEALVVAIHKAENAKEAKLSAEQELRTWRAENEQRRKEYVQESRNPRLSFEKNLSSNFVHVAHTVLPQNGYTKDSNNNSEKDASTENEDKGTKKKKKSFFPRIFMFLARRRAHANKSK